MSGGTTQAITYGYDNRGHQNQVTADGSTWTSTYKLLGQVPDEVDPDAGHSAMQYDAAGLLTQSTDSRGKIISYAYDALGRKTGTYDAPPSWRRNCPRAGPPRLQPARFTPPRYNIPTPGCVPDG